MTQYESKIAIMSAHPIMIFDFKNPKTLPPNSSKATSCLLNANSMKNINVCFFNPTQSYLVAKVPTTVSASFWLLACPRSLFSCGVLCHETTENGIPRISFCAA